MTTMTRTLAFIGFSIVSASSAFAHDVVAIRPAYDPASATVVACTCRSVYQYQSTYMMIERYFADGSRNEKSIGIVSYTTTEDALRLECYRVISGMVSAGTCPK